MKTSTILLGTTVFFAFLTMMFGYQGLLQNYMYWTCWDNCLWDTDDCEEICKDVEPKNPPQITRDEKRDKSQKIHEMYDPIIDEYTESIGIMGGPFSRGTGYTHPNNLEDNLDASFEYSDGFFKHIEKLEIVSPLSDSENARQVSVVKAMIFPEMYVFLIFTIGIGVIVGFRIRK